MHKMTVIGSVRSNSGETIIHINPEFRDGLLGLSDFSHVHVFWIADQLSSLAGVPPLSFPSPYTASDAPVGVFASRSPIRPTPLCVSICQISDLNMKLGTIRTPYIDALTGTQIIDLKPYFPASDRIDTIRMPDHFAHWPKSFEASTDFDWESEFR